MREERWQAILHALKTMEPARRRRMLAGFPAAAIRAIDEEWWWQRLRGQIEPPGDWRVWLIMAGRGFGKTRAGAEWVWERARTHEGARIALVGGSLDEVAKVMVEGDSGLIRAARSDEDVVWRPTRGEIWFPSGAIGQAYSGSHPAKLRGPQHDFAWCDELAKWRYPAATWANLEMGMRLGERPRIVVTTTPAPGAVLKAIAAAKDSALTRGRTEENPHLPDAFVSAMIEQYGGTRLGRQELDGILFDDVAGALWTRELIEKCRSPEMGTVASNCPLVRVVIGVDPPASPEGTCGIVACAMGADGVAFVLGDHSVTGVSPNGWAARVASAAETWRADKVIAEKNNGGDMVGEVLAGAEAALPVKLVSASRGKSARAEPIATRFEAGKAKFSGRFPELEDELCGLTGGGEYAGPGTSPDRADAMVWAMTELFRPPREPHVRGF